MKLLAPVVVSVSKISKGHFFLKVVLYALGTVSTVAEAFTNRLACQQRCAADIMNFPTFDRQFRLVLTSAHSDQPGAFLVCRT